MRRAAYVLFALLAALVSAVGCSANVLPAPGQIMLVLATDMTPGRDFDTIVVRVADPTLSSELLYDWRFRAAAGGRFEGDLALPATVALVRQTPGSGAVTTIRVEARLGGVPRVVREASVVVPSTGVQMLRMSLDWLCWDMMPAGTAGAANGLTCADGFACSAGECVETSGDRGPPAPWDPSMVFGSADGGARADACFQVLGCFMRASTVTPTLDAFGSCSFAYAGSTDDLNVAIVLPPSAQRGFCAKDACLIPLDLGAAGGWQPDEGRVTVARRVCTQGLQLALSTACASKTETKPPCAEWSSVGLSPGANNDALTLGLRPAGSAP